MQSQINKGFAKRMKKKVLFLSAWYPTKIDSMAGLFVQQHAKAISDSWDVAVLHCLPVDNGQKKYEIDVSHEFNLLTIRIYYKKIYCKIPVFKGLVMAFRFAKAYIMGYHRIVAMFGVPQLLHVNILTRVGVFALYLKILYGIPYVITEHWSRYLPERNEYKGLLRKIITRWVVRESNAISTVSQKLRASMIVCGIRHQNFLIINNMVDCNLFRPNLIAKANEKKLFSHISCFDDYSKNISGILRSIRKLAQRRDDFVCLLVGDGKDKEKIEQSANDLVLKNIVHFTGILGGEQLVEVYNKSLFTVLFSNFENMPVVISESFACGKPVIATKTGGIPEIVREKNGILVLPGNEHKFEEALDFMLDNVNRFDANEIREFAEKTFSKDTINDQLLLLYRQTAK